MEQERTIDRTSTQPIIGFYIDFFVEDFFYEYLLAPFYILRGICNIQVRNFFR